MTWAFCICCCIRFGSWCLLGPLSPSLKGLALFVATLAYHLDTGPEYGPGHPIVSSIQTSPRHVDPAFKTSRSSDVDPAVLPGGLHTAGPHPYRGYCLCLGSACGMGVWIVGATV
jgi:hypothetical protein